MGVSTDRLPAPSNPRPGWALGARLKLGVLLAGVGCASARHHELALDGVPVPVGADARTTQASVGGAWDGVRFTTGFQALLQVGDPVGDDVFGQLRSRTGTPIALCEGLDYTGLWRPNGALEMITHFECQPGALFRTALGVEGNGVLKVTSSRRVDTVPIDGGNYFCAGAPTDWGTHLATEEYEADARKRLADGTVSDNFEDYNLLAHWWDGDLTRAHPWQYGWVVEVPGEGAAARRWAMGRFSHEQALPMPDGRTVYLSDDNAEGGAFFLFQADTAGDLSAGTLYASRWVRQGDGSYTLDWRSLGHATDVEVEAAVSPTATFEELFDVAAPTGEVCPAGLTLTWSSWGAECLRIREGQAPAATRLEARRAAALAGATVELVKTEGMALDEEDARLFLSITRYEKAALGGAAGPGARDELQLAENACGGVWGLALAAGEGPSGPWVARSAAPVLEGRPEGEDCAADGIANPDNLAWIPGTGTLVIGEDTSRHPNNMLWFYDLGHRRLTRVLTAPLGAEVSGLRWTGGVGGKGYVSVAIQHPSEGHSTAGVFGPFPDATESP